MKTIESNILVDPRTFWYILNAERSTLTTTTNSLIYNLSIPQTRSLLRLTTYHLPKFPNSGRTNILIYCLVIKDISQSEIINARRKLKFNM